MKKIKLFCLAFAAMAGIGTATPCSRVVFLGDDNMTMVGRTLDWRTPIPTNIYVYPAGIEKQSMPSGEMLTWRSKYGSVLAVGYDGGVTEGMNDQGMVMSGLFCKGTVYKEATGNDNMPVMSLAVIVSYFLDNFATVDEVDTWLKANDFGIFGKTFDGGTVSTLHWAVTDVSGMTLLMEYVDGQLTTYRSRDLQVLTNDPPLPQMQAINSYWQKVGGVNMLPGTVRSSDRFARADFFIHHVPTNVTYDVALGSVASVMGNVAVPLGYEVQGEPNLSSTQWTSIADLKRGRYYFRFADSLTFFYIDMGRLELRQGAPILKLDTTDHSYFAGCVNGRLKKSDGFTPMW